MLSNSPLFLVVPSSITLTNLLLFLFGSALVRSPNVEKLVSTRTPIRIRQKTLGYRGTLLLIKNFLKSFKKSGQNELGIIFSGFYGDDYIVLEFTWLSSYSLALYSFTLKDRNLSQRVHHIGLELVRRNAFT